jgi:5-methylcytosine-specific restriction endonuclease McrA
MTPFRIYEPAECGTDGYPLAWHKIDGRDGVKLIVKREAGFRCVRCGHPYKAGCTDPEWSRCDSQCRHDGPRRIVIGDAIQTFDGPLPMPYHAGMRIDARWRILTVHHLRLGHDAKRDLRWWNLVALCQRCHLQVQGKVLLERIWPWPHSEWFKPYAAGWYAWSYLGEDLTREQVEARMDELLALELVA